MSIEVMVSGILAMAGVTAACRILPFILPQESRLLYHLSSDKPVIKIVGPALIVALAVATLTQPILNNPAATTLVAVAAGAAGTTIAFFMLRSVGLAVVLGVASYGVAKSLLGV